MKMKSLVIATAFGLGSLTLSAAAHAESPSFSYLSAGYTEIDEGTTFDGFEIEASGRLGRHAFLSGRYTDTSGSYSGLGSVDWESTLGRLGFIFGENQRVAAYAGPQVSYISTGLMWGPDNEWQAGSESSTDWGAFGGVRAMVLPMLELNGEISYIDFDRNSFTSYAAGTKLYFTRNLAATGQVRMGDLDGFTVGLSYNF